MKKIILTLIMIAPIVMVNAQANRNYFLNTWTGPYGGVPAFTDYKLKDLKPALEFAIQEKLNEIKKIANNPKAATFTNTIVAMEKAGKRFSQVYAVFGIYSSNMNSPEFEPIETEMTPKIYDLSNKVYQNAKLFARISKVYNSPSTKKLTKEQQRLVWLYYSNFVREGAKATAKSKTRIAAINQELAGLFTKFSQNQLADESNYYLELKTEADFDDTMQLIDEIGFNIHPVLLGSGIPVFHEMDRQIDLELLECKTLKGGCVMVTYRVKPPGVKRKRE